MPDVYRVFNGWTGNGGIHRIVLADSAAEAIQLAIEVASDAKSWKPGKCFAERVLFDASGKVEASDVDL